MSLLVLPAYSFADISGLLAGPGGSVPFGMGYGSDEEGITFDQNESNNRMTVGAGGDVQNTLVLDLSGRCAIHLLKTSPLNAQLDAMFTYQKQSSANWGQNVITTSNPVTGDKYTCNQVAFTKRPANSFGKDARPLVWEFDCGQIFALLGGR